MAQGEKFKLLIHSAKQVVQVTRNGERVVTGSRMNELAILEGNGEEGYSIVISKDGIIHDIGLDFNIAEKYKNAAFQTKLNASGRCILPGLVDAHTHPVWDGDRVNEFSMKLAGATYMDLHNSGGGIYFTVERTKLASEDKLLSTLKLRLLEMLKAGTTLVEAKSGYGLDAQSELKMLKVIERAKNEVPVEISSTFCGAHAVPRNMTAEEATEAILSQHLLLLEKEIASGAIKVDNIDVFCEEGVFNVQQTRSILEAGRKKGLAINFHGDELHAVGAAEMGAEIKAEAISHLEKISMNGIQAMAEASSVAVILPTTAYMLKLTPPPVRTMIEMGVPVALGSDFNPNAFCLSMPIVMHLACVLCKMTMAESLTAATINSAAALKKSNTHGSIEIGKVADVIIINSNRWEHLIYQMGNHRSLINFVIKSGNIVIQNEQTKLI